MSTPICGTPGCDRPTTVGFLCRTCLDILRRDLDAIPDLVADLMVTISRQDRLTDATQRDGENRLPLRVGPMEAKRDLDDTLAVWARHVAERRGTETPPLHDPVEVGAWLSRHVGDVQDDPLAGQIADELGYAVLTGQRAVDKPLQLRYVGPCDLCGGDLYAHPRAATVASRNPRCDAEYNIPERREWLLSQAEYQLLTATEMSRALPGLLPPDPSGREQTLTPSMIRGYAHRGRLTKHPAHPARPHEPLYLVYEVINLLADLQRNESNVAC